MSTIYDLPCPHRAGLHYLWHENAPVIFVSYYDGGDYCDCKKVIYYDTIFLDTWDETENYIQSIEESSGNKRRNISKLKYDRYMEATAKR